MRKWKKEYKYNILNTFNHIILWKSTCPIYIRKRFFKLMRNSSEICLDDPCVPCVWAQAASAWWPLAFCILYPA